MPSERDIAMAVWQIKGRFLNATAGDTERYTLRSGLECEYPLVRLMAASLVISEHVTELWADARTILAMAIGSNQIGGSFPQIFFWEAMVLMPLDQVDTNELFDVVETHFADGRNENTNIYIVLYRLARSGLSRAQTLLSKYEAS